MDFSKMSRTGRTLFGTLVVAIWMVAAVSMEPGAVAKDFQTLTPQSAQLKAPQEEALTPLTTAGLLTW